MIYQLWDRIRDWVLLYLFLATSIIVMVSRNDPMIRGMRNLSLHMTGRVEAQFAWAGWFLRAIDENTTLRQENIELTNQLARLRQSDLQIQQLSGVLAFQESSTYPTVAARVLTKDIFGQTNLLTLDAGRSDGVEIDMPVVSTDGILGRIVFVSAHYSRVMPFRNTNFHVPAEIQGLQIAGIIRWLGDHPDLLSLDNIVKTEAVMEGQQVLTSHASDIFPSGYPVGTIASVKSQRGENMLEIRVRPAVSLGNLQYAFVLLRHGDAERDSLEQQQFLN